MRNSEIYRVEMTFIERLKFLFLPYHEEISTLLSNERHRYFRLGRMLTVKRVTESSLRAVDKLGKYKIEMYESRGNTGHDLEVGISYRLEGYLRH